MRQKPINDGTISGLRVPKCDKFTKFPVKFPVRSENRQSRGPPALRRQPTSLMSRDFPYSLAKKPAVDGFLALGGESLGTKFEYFRAAVPKISAYVRQGGRFLEKRVGDGVRLHCVTGLPVETVASVRIPPVMRRSS